MQCWCDLAVQRRVRVVIRFQMTQETETRTVEEEVELAAAGPDLSSVEVRTVFDSPELGALGRGELRLTVFPAAVPARQLAGTLVSRISCDIFDCVLQPDPHIAGIAFLYFSRTGGLQYSIKSVLTTSQPNKNY